MRVKAIQLEPVAEAPPSPPPGVYYDLDDGLYNSWKDAFRSGWANKLLGSTPAHLRWAIDHPNESTPALILGRIVHAALLEPERFDKEFARGPDVRLNTNIGKDQWARVEADNPGKELLRFDDYNTAAQIVESVWERPENQHIRNYLLACEEREVTVLWPDEATSVKCRARIDALGRGAGLIVDVKSTTCAAPGAFESAIVEYGYAVQSALYRRACEWAGWAIEDSIIIAVEKEPPFLASALELTGPIVQEGDRQLAEALAIFAECERTGRWPGYESKTIPVSFPTWYWRKLESRG